MGSGEKMVVVDVHVATGVWRGASNGSVGIKINDNAQDLVCLVCLQDHHACTGPAHLQTLCHRTNVEQFPRASAPRDSRLLGLRGLLQLTVEVSATSQTNLRTPSSCRAYRLRWPTTVSSRKALCASDFWRSRLSNANAIVIVIVSVPLMIP